MYMKEDQYNMYIYIYIFVLDHEGSAGSNKYGVELCNTTEFIKGIGKAKSHFWGIFKSFKSIISGVIQPLGDLFHVVG